MIDAAHWICLFRKSGLMTGYSALNQITPWELRGADIESATKARLWKEILSSYRIRAVADITGSFLAFRQLSKINRHLYLKFCG